MARLIAELSDVSQIERGVLDVEMLPFDLDKTVEEVVSEVASQHQGFELRLDKSEIGLHVTGDRPRIHQVIANLVNNALKYAGERKEADVRIRREDHRAVVEVADRGIGIPEAERAQVFDLYFRATNAGNASAQGLGLGLYISKAIVERHGGEIGVQSQEGKGSTFWFALPIHSPATQAEGAST